ncbi:MAG: response regulator transcription factor [Chloroflexota bacterium]
MAIDTQIKVLIVDDHDIVRYGLKLLLEAFDDFEVVGETGDGRMALTLCHTYQPDVVLIELLMPYMNGITATELIHHQFPDIKIIALTRSAEGTLVQAALKAGAISYLLKNAMIDEVARAVRAAYCGTAVLAPEAAQALISVIQHPNNIGSDLSKQELKVLALVVQGLNNREIADRLVISVSTVKHHISSILSKLNARSRVEATVLTIEHQILSRTVP